MSFTSGRGYADDTLSESVTEFASGTLKLGIKDLTPEVLAELLGQAVDKNSVVWAGKRGRAAVCCCRVQS